MKINKIKRFNISKDLNILRGFVDSMIACRGDLLVSAAYRNGRVFARYDENLELLYRIEEDCLCHKGLGDFRCMAADETGNQALAGSILKKTVGIITLDEDGDISRVIRIPDFKLLHSFDFDSYGNIYLHSPLKEYPVYLYPANDLKNPIPIGEYPVDARTIEQRSARILIDKEQNINIFYENKPGYFNKYSPDGKKILDKKISCSPDKNTNLLILDVSIDKLSGDIYLLTPGQNEKERILHILDPLGNTKKRFSFPRQTRKIAISPDGILYSSGTIFGIHMLILTLKLYGAITYIDVNTIIR